MKYCAWLGHQATEEKSRLEATHMTQFHLSKRPMNVFCHIWARVEVEDTSCALQNFPRWVLQSVLLESGSYNFFFPGMARKMGWVLRKGLLLVGLQSRGGGGISVQLLNQELRHGYVCSNEHASGVSTNNETRGVQAVLFHP